MPPEMCNLKLKRSRVRRREAYLASIQKEMWPEHQIPHIPVEAVAELVTDLFTSTCGARRLAGLHLPEAVRESHRSNISPCSLVLALLYLERLKTANNQHTKEYLADVTPSELFIVSMMVANKFAQDEGETSEVENWYWSDLSGFDNKQLNKLERQFLAAIRWEVFISDKEFWSSLLRLHRTICLRQGLRRGWFTYSETAAILDILPLSDVLLQAVQLVAACCAGYIVATAACILLAPLLASAPIHQLLVPLQMAVQHKAELAAPVLVERLSQDVGLTGVEPLSLYVNLSQGQRLLQWPLFDVNRTGQLGVWVT